MKPQADPCINNVTGRSIKGLRGFQHYLLQYATMFRLLTTVASLTGIFQVIIRPQVPEASALAFSPKIKD